jgi:hypothetical protein
MDSWNACYQSVQKLFKIVKIKTHTTALLSVVLYGYETWSVTSREERRLKMFENGVLRKVFRPQREKATGNWTRLHNEAPHVLYKYFFVVFLAPSRNLLS